MDVPPQPNADVMNAAPVRPVKRRRLLRELIEMLCIVLVVFVGIRMFLQPYAVDGASMSPYLESGERVFVNRTAYAHIDVNALWNVLPWEDRAAASPVYPFSKPQRGDIIVLESEQTSRDEQYIKRIIAMPGETVTFAEGLVLIDGEPLVEDYIEGAITGCGHVEFCSVTVPEGHVYVLGDNRLDSEDSRSFGAIPYEDIVGKAIFSNWPFEKIGPIRHPDYGEPADGT